MGVLRRTQPQWFETGVETPAEVVLVRQKAQRISALLGFSKRKQAEITLSASELAQNHIDHHTQRGKIRINGQIINKTAYLVLASLDEGPGIADVTNALSDGISTSKGLGSGLGSIVRLSDDWAICSRKIGPLPCPDLEGLPLNQTIVSASFWSAPLFEGIEAHLDFSCLVRPFPGEDFCGDAHHIATKSDFVRITLVDALGHGKKAAESVETILEILDILPASLDPQQVIQHISQGLVNASRGVSAQILRLDTSKGIVSCSGIGNVGAILYLDGRRCVSINRPGILGTQSAGCNEGRSQRFEGVSSILAFMHTDGIASPPPIPQDAALGAFSPLLWNQILFRLTASGLDDASLMVWQWKKR